MSNRSNKRWHVLLVSSWLWAGQGWAAHGVVTASGVSYDALDMERIAAEDTARYDKALPLRFAIGHDLSVVPGRDGNWTEQGDGTSNWTFTVRTPDAVHLNFGFGKFHLPPSGRLTIKSDANEKLDYSSRDNLPTGQLWTNVLVGREATLTVEVQTAERDQLQLELVRVGQGYRGFGFRSKHCKSGRCNTDVACLGNTDPWNENRRSVAAILLGGTDTCTGSLVNNTAGDRRLLFATAAHCGIDASNVASLVAIFNYESPTCRTPGSVASGQPVPRPNTTLSGMTWLASTNNPFGGGGAANTRSDWTLVELASSPNQSSYNLFWSGWDRSAPPTVCDELPSGSTTSTVGLCASIHHPNVDEKRITFVEENMIVDNISSATGVHWRANWDPTPPILPNISNPPSPLPPSVTEPGSSGSPLYNRDRRLVGVLSGGPSSCGATGASLRDQYGGLFASFEGGGTATTRMRDHLDPLGSNPVFIDGIGQCNPPTVPNNVSAVTNGDNRVDISWTAVAGAERYRVFRAAGTCPGSGAEQIAEVTGTSYSDTTVSGGSVYAYTVAAYDDAEACQSQQSSCSSVTATGLCALAPTFSGVVSAGSAGQSTCGINLTWNAAGGNCGAGSNLVYNIYRSTSPGFTPAAGNRIASCRAGTAYSDSPVAFGTRYYYAVRAEDTGAAGSGVCGGVEESNSTLRDAVPAGPDAVSFSDDMEAGPANWTVAGSGGGANFALVTTQSQSPVNAWFVPNPTVTSSRTLALANPISVPASGAPSTLEFFHRYDTEVNFDGGLLEYSLDGTTWTNILGAQGAVPANANRFLAGGYNATMSSNGAFGAVAAWHGNVNSAWLRSAVDLADFAGQNVRFRFRFGSDTSLAGTGWWIDDVRVYAGSICTEITDRLLYDGFE